MSFLCSTIRRYAVAITVSACFLSLSAKSVQQQQGTVNMQGSIIDRACTIATGDLQQSLNLGTLPLSALVHKGKGGEHRFSIHLTDCVLDSGEWRQDARKGFQITFDGPASNALFALEGTASGVALRIRDAAGNNAIPGKALPEQRFSTGDMQLNYTLTPVRNQQPLIAGDYFSTIRFTLDYF